jgi:mannitol/fructose-specific phosphotransferase system IIA component (Ntr-type)
MREPSLEHLYRRQEMRFWPRKSNEDLVTTPALTPEDNGDVRISDRLPWLQVIVLDQQATLPEVCGRLVSTWSGVDKERVLTAILEREAISATLISPEITLPHARLLAFGPLRAALAVCPKGLTGAEAVRLVLLFVGDLGKPREALAFLSNAAALFGQDGLKDRLAGESDPRSVLDLIRQAEAR